MDTIIILTNENCGACSALKGDGHIDALNITKNAGSWWTSDNFKTLICGGTDRQKFKVYEFEYRAEIATYAVKEFSAFNINKSGNVERLRYYESFSGNVGYQINRGIPDVIDEKYEEVLRKVVPAGIYNYFYAWPIVLFISGDRYDESVSGAAKRGLLAHVAGFNVVNPVENIYMIERKPTFIQKSPMEYAMEITREEINLDSLPTPIKSVYDDLKPKDALEYQIISRHRKYIE